MPTLYFILPAALIVGAVLLFPVLYALGLSFFHYPLVDDGTRQFNGLQNYWTLFTDPEFWNSLWRQLGFILIAIPIELVIGFFVALLFSRDFFAGKVLRTLLLLPVFILPVLSGLTWRLMLQPEYGALSFLLSKIGFGGKTILAEPNLAYTAVIVQDIWRMWPFMFMILYAGLSNIPRELLEAANLDGAGFFKKITSVTIPLLKPTITTALLLRVIDALRIFSEIFVMTDGGPGNATMLFSIYTYRQAFKYFNIGIASAMAVILLIIAILFALTLVRKNMDLDTM
ncbi:MAG TPA: sugar ABC transporter permease [Thermotogota bacterium]|nr:sugar ABC transporter permease [Thermotogota bacterium]HRW92448.1 sugar ABC transporter permease [Thermotogota bacterium]